MDTYITEAEQIERLKQWAKKYGFTIAITFLIVICAVLGWRFWQHREEALRYQASASYEKMLMNVVSNQDDDAIIQAQRVIKEYPKTPYAGLSALILAKLEVKKGNLELANQQLKWVIQHSDSASVRQIARIRSARILLALKKPELALDTLKKVDDKTYLSEILAVQGRVYNALGNKDKAHALLKQALALLPTDALNRPILQMEYDNLALNHSEQAKQ